MKFIYCQSEIEAGRRCEEQCKHCKEYYVPMEKEHHIIDEIENKVKKICCNNTYLLDEYEVKEIINAWILDKIKYRTNENTPYIGHPRIP